MKADNNPGFVVSANFGVYGLIKVLGGRLEKRDWIAKLPKAGTPLQIKILISFGEG